MAMDATTPLVEGRSNARHDSSALRRCLCCIAITIATLAMVIILLAGTNKRVHFLDVACDVTFYPETCKETLVGIHRASPEEMTRTAVSSAARGVAKTLTTIVENRGGDERVGLRPGESVCDQTLASSIEQLKASLAVLESDVTQYPFDELKTRLSAAMEFHTTCIDTLMETGTLDDRTVHRKEHTEKLLSNALAFVNALARFGTNVRTWELTNSVDGAPNPNPDCAKKLRKFFNPVQESGQFPSWMSSEQALLIDADPPIDVVVAKDGSGKFKSIQAAIDAAPKSGSATAKRYVIRIKAGVYDEQVTVPKTATNFMFLGDGAAKSTITGSKSVAKTPGMTTFLSASLSKKPTAFSLPAFSL